MTRRPIAVRLITWLPVGGIERRLSAVVPRLADAGWDMRVICLREEGPLANDLRAKGIPVEVITLRTRLSPPGIAALRRRLREIAPDVVHSHMYRSNIPGTIAARLAGVKTIFGQIHNVDSWDTPRQAMMDRAVSRWRTGTIAVSGAVQADVMKRLGLPAERVPLLYNGIDTDAFQPNAALRGATRNELGIAPASVAILVPARLHPQKNPRGMLEAYAKAIEGWPGPPPVLLFAGAGKLEEEVRVRVAAMPGVDIRLLGARDDMAALYNASDAIALASFKEGFSNALVEALACGKPAIASDVGGNREAVDRPDVGWVHGAGDVETLAAHLREALALGVDGLAAMAPACRSRAMDFSLNALVSRTDALYRQGMSSAR